MEVVERRARWWWPWGRRAVGAAVAMVLLLGGYAGCARAVENRDEMPASYALHMESFAPEVMPNSRETTAQTCTQGLPCRWAVTSDTAVVMMFDRQEDACRAADTLPATVRQNWVAVHFTPGALSVRQRSDLMAHLARYERDSDAAFVDNLNSWLPWVERNCS